MWALRVVALLLCVEAARLPFSCLLSILLHPFPSLSLHRLSCLFIFLAIKLPDARPRWVRARHPGRQPMSAYRAAGRQCPRSRGSRASAARSPEWASCAPGSRSCTFQQAGVTRSLRCESLSLGLQGQRRALWARRTVPRCLLREPNASTATPGLAL